MRLKSTFRSHSAVFTVAVGLGMFTVLPAGAAPDQTPPDHALTIYNQNFAVVRQTIPLDLKAGLNHVTVSGITYHLEPDSVVLRDPSGKRSLQIREQNYRADPISQELLLSVYEGKTIDFQVQHGDQTSIVSGKIICSGYVPHTDAYAGFGSQYQSQQQSFAYGSAGQPIIEVGGRLQFTLPGTPLFPGLPDDSILKPTLDWQLVTDKAGPLNAELAYVTGGMTWTAAYNVVSPEVGDTLDLTAWVTMDNESGRTFENARIKLMAGDVSKVQNQTAYLGAVYASGGFRSADSVQPSVTEKTFDEYHLYTLANQTTLRDREIKQVQFAHAANVASSMIYVYDGLQIDQNQYSGWGYDNIRSQPSYGTTSNRKIYTMREFVNSAANGLGIPLPKGRMRFYRRDTDGQLEFIGENDIDHTPKDETVRVYTGNAFDLTGDRKQTNYTIDSNGRTADESFAITLHNHKTVPAEIRVVEHLYRGANWAITAKTNTFLKTDANTIEFRVTLAPGTDKTLSYTTHYTW
ncbi:MAG: DUF4139 domain-containing protein [Janthinobacterium lividum]